MKAIIVFCSLLAVGFAQDEFVCYDTYQNYCSEKEVVLEVKNNASKCNALYGGAESIMDNLSRFANAHVTLSFDYLLLATNFGSYQKDRKGFEKLFRHLSDKTWEDGIELIKYIAKRGGKMDFGVELDKTEYKKSALKLNEIQGLAHALDTQKMLATKAFTIHSKASENNKDHEPEVASYLEEKFLHKHADIIRSLAGHISDVKQMLSYPGQQSVSLFLFDEYLKNHM